MQETQRRAKGQRRAMGTWLVVGKFIRNYGKATISSLPAVFIGAMAGKHSQF
jgi:hypothetical protein